MKTTIKTKQGDFTINTTYHGNTLAPWDEKKQNYNNHTVKVGHNSKYTSFQFWGSIMSPEITKENDCINALYCFVSDSLCAEGSFEDFCSEFGYDTDSRKAEKIYKACEKSLKKLQRIFDGDIYELINELSELNNV